MNGAQRNQARAQTLTENDRMRVCAGGTKSTVHAVRTAIAADVEILMRMHGIIVSATMWVALTGGGGRICY